MRRAIHEFTASLDGLRFPDRCLACGAPPTGDHEIDDRQGSFEISLPVPFCRACEKKLVRQKLRWHLAWIGAAFVGFVALSRLQDTDYFGAHGFQFGLLTIPTIALVFWWVMRREQRTFHERFSRVWIRRFVPEQTVTLASREPDTLRAIALASSVDPAAVR